MERKIYKQDAGVFVLLIFFVIILFMLGSAIPNRGGGAFIFFAVLITIRYALFYLRSGVELTEDSIIVKQGAITLSEDEAKYNKINKVEVRKGIMFNDISIYVGNDSPLVFKNISKVNELKETLMQRIENK